jgi:putative ABC transport system ATP-binding protein
MSAIVRLEDVTKDYQEGALSRSVLRGVTIAFPAGRFTAVRGRSGSGKTTLLNLIAGIDYPSRGDVYIGDVCVTALNPRERTVFRRDNIGFVFQFFNLIPTLTVLENVRLPAELAGRDDGQRGLELLELVGLADRRGVFPDRLSGGEQQRVAIARALVHRPRLLLADEPTGNLDDRTGDAILSLLDDLVQQAGSSLIMVTHSRHVAALADCVLEMHDGQLAPAAEAAA